ncbi:hypothetical protein GF415_01160 [Candidatus Micrarchaeota archaeon]|nr:hypothetical protein [Candidatus Micrarchaeota archaeon]
MKKQENAKDVHPRGAEKGKSPIRDKSGMGGQEGLSKGPALSAIKRVLAASKALPSVQKCRVNEDNLLTDRLSMLLAQAGESPGEADAPVADRMSLLKGTLKAVDSLLTQDPEKTGLSQEDSAALAALGLEMERSLDANEYVVWLSKPEPAHKPPESGRDIPKELEEWGRGAEKGPLIGRGV